MNGTREKLAIARHALIGFSLVLAACGCLSAGAQEGGAEAPQIEGLAESVDTPDRLVETMDASPEKKAEEQAPAADAEEKKTAAFDSEAILPSLVIIEVETKDGKAFGSGFVAEMGGKKYLVTNQHVLDGFDSISMNTLNNDHLKPLSFEICPLLDLARMEITNDVPALSIGEKSAKIGLPIAVYGNSEGGGVATEIKGEILGVGPDLIEVDAEFVQGNSGCPIIDESGTVLGVASFATLFEDPENWLSKETRFQKVRRYGIRLDTCAWQPCNPRTFSQQGKFISDAETAIMDYVAIIDFFAHKDGFKNYVKDGGRETYSPNAAAYNMESFYKSSTEYYKVCCSMLRTYIDSVKNGRDETSTARILRNLGRESIRHLEEIDSSLQKQRYASKYLKTRADELSEVCRYCINEHW